MSAAAEQEAAFVAASDSFQADPAGTINNYATRAASLRASNPWQASEQVRHVILVGLLLARTVRIEPGHTLERLAQAERIEL
ncbi:MAG: hypothetical protein AB1627_02530 [Chloroflexota bacterium]